MLLLNCNEKNYIRTEISGANFARLGKFWKNAYLYKTRHSIIIFIFVYVVAGRLVLLVYRASLRIAWTGHKETPERWRMSKKAIVRQCLQATTNLEMLYIHFYLW